jgi:hypothetical protein
MAHFLGAAGLAALAVAAPTALDAASAVPQLSGHWGRTNFNLEQPPAGPRFIVNTLKKPDGTLDEDSARIGDFNSPLLTPAGAAILKRHGEFSRTGESIPDPHNQCHPEPPPFTLTIQIGLLLLQTKDEVVLVYVNGNNVRHVRLNAEHPKTLTPTWLGDSIGHYEGDTLVVDTVGIKTQGELSVIDRYGTPFSEHLHVVERYRLIDGKDAAAAIRAHRREFNTNDAIPRFDIYGASFDPDTSKQGLQVEVTVDDPGIFRAPWKGLVTYQPMSNWPEMVCAESLTELTGPPRDVPTAEKADF